MKRRATLVALAIAAGLPSLVSAGDRLPVRPAPPGFRVVDVPGGGRIVEGPLGSGVSGATAFLAGLRRVHAYFGSSPTLASAVRSTDGSLTVGLFRERLGREPVAGIAFVNYAPNGGSRIAMLVDRPRHLQTSFHPMLARLASLGSGASASGGGSAPAALSQVTAQDGTVSIGLPAGWKTDSLAQGAAVVEGPDGAEVLRGVVMEIMDPRGGMAHAPGARAQGVVVAYTGDPAQAYAAVSDALAQRSGAASAQVHVEKSAPMQAPFAGAHAASIAGTETVRGKRMRFAGNLSVGPPTNYGTWSIAVNVASAPVDRFAAEASTLAAVTNSYGFNQERRGAQVRQSIAQSEAQGAAGRAMLARTTANDAALANASMAHARAVQDGIDRSTAGFVHYLAGTDVLEHTTTGARGSVDAGFAQAVVQSDPQNFRTVPVSQYRKGVDY